MKLTRGHEPGAPSEVRDATFTGAVSSDPVIAGIDGVTVNTVMFPPGARTHWHRHDRGQLLFVTHGRGYVGTRAGEVDTIGPGDVVWFAPDEEHWHGAGPDTWMSHVAISLGGHAWLDELADDDFAAAIAGV
ncbi:cupin domain-containing protein [Conexibacter sp. CPCC 206217]|uniref:cupin domain-containing protein n=1 Tax=Conexibacter sp. CPCC 206217 TaxID=3064574 RepID=UPI002725D466|nr:cupin domain-containing protein [Conexibacter sp. CPCC 206217]MDO8212244.1 cupin domain-containing protein [Conexibacter sp. CPCC 206217]